MDVTLALIQYNPHVGDLAGNLELMTALATQAKDRGVTLLLFPELALVGYPPEDLLHKPLFLRQLRATEIKWHQRLEQLGVDAIYGSVRQREGGGLVNAAILVVAGQEVGFVGKWFLPNYGVFDEHRYFVPETTTRPLPYRGLRLGLTVCEDIWQPGGPASSLAAQGADLLITLNASPFHVGKTRERLAVAAARVAETGLPLFYVNMVGGQDELVFEGGSFVLNQHGELVASAMVCGTEIVPVTMHHSPDHGVTIPPARITPQPEPLREIYQVLCLGLADYVRKNGFQGVVLGLSGGVDSALTAAICVDALGPEQVECFMLPSHFTSNDSLEDAVAVAQRLGIRLGSLSIQPMFDAFRQELATEFAGLAEDVTEENIQPRIRATLLMAISNKKGLLLVTTGNKSEVSVGYATLYGDMAGGFSVLKDLLKETVYQLCHARNQWAEAAGTTPPIPSRVIEKAPTAELRFDQKDTDSLPPYPILDRILRLYVEEEQDVETILATGIDLDTTLRVIRLVDRNEYKRRQAPPGVRISRKAFGKDRRYPITNGFRVDQDR